MEAVDAVVRRRHTPRSAEAKWPPLLSFQTFEEALVLRVCGVDAEARMPLCFA